MRNSLTRLLLILFIPFLSMCTEKGEQAVGKKGGEGASVEASLNKQTPIDPQKRFPLLISEDHGSSWENASYNLPHDIQVSFLEPKGEEIVMATDNKGVFLSRGKRTSWQAIGTELPGQKINALCVAGEVIYVGVYKQGIYQSVDEGASWESLNYELPNLTVQSIARIEDRLFVGTDDGIFIKAEEESRWVATSVTTQVLSIYMRETYIVAGTSQGTVISEDGGSTWKWIRQKGAVHYTHPIGNRIHELVLNGDLVYSDDWGQSWKETDYGPRAGSYIYEIVAVGEFELLSNNYGIHRSSDKGNTWKLIYLTEEMGFFDLLVIGDTVYGGTREWDEFRKRNPKNSYLDY